MISIPGICPKTLFAFQQTKICAEISNVVSFGFLATLLLLSGDVERNPGPISFLQLHCRSPRVRGRASELSRIALANDADVLCLCETWLRATDETPNVTGYTIVHRVDRADGSTLGGGVITYAKPTIPITHKEELIIRKAEIHRLEVRISYNRSVEVCNFYVSPEVTGKFEWTRLGNDRTLLMGDCNIRGHWDSNPDTLHSACLEQFLLETRHLTLKDGSPTFIRKDYCSSVDMTAVPADLVLECEWKTLLIAFSDHLPILTTVHSYSQRTKKHGRARWNFHRADWTAYQAKLDLLFEKKAFG